jgi:WD40 repeat protein
LTASSSQRACPYVGPRAFAAGEALYGRDRELADLTDLVIAERVVLLYAPSGAGKSSLLQAGLVPRLRAEGFAVRPVARVGMAPPVDCANPLVLSALLSFETDVPKDRSPPLAELAGRTLAGYLDERRRRDAVDADVVIFDQFEEALTGPADLDVRQAFFHQLGEALRDADRYCVLALREDRLAAVDPFRAALPTRLRATFRLDLLGPDAALRAVQAPARAAGVEFSDAAAARLVDDLRQVKLAGPGGVVVARPGPHVEPVQLQVVCRSLWGRLPADARAIDEGHVAGLGDVDHALAGYIDEQVAGVSARTGAPERHLRRWLARHLVTDHGLRAQVLRTAGMRDALPDAAVDGLVDTHLLRVEDRRGMTWIELAHDRLVAPMLASNAAYAAAHRDAVETQAELWDRQGRPRRLLLADGPALARAAAAGVARTPVEQAFLEESRAELAVLARARRARILVLVSGVLAGLGLIVAMFAYRDAVRSQAYADLRRLEAERQLAIAEFRLVATRAQFLPRTEVDVAALLAVHAADQAARLDDVPEYEARGVLLGFEAQHPRVAGLFAPGLRPDGLAPHPRAPRVALVDEGAVELWDLRTRARVWSLSLGATGPLAFTPDGATLLAAAGGSLAEIDVERGAPRATLPVHTAALTALAADGRLAAAAAGADLALVDLAARTVGARRTLPDVALALHLRADALEVADAAGHLGRLGLPDLAPAPDPRRFAEVRRAVFSPDGARVALLDAAAGDLMLAGPGADDLEFVRADGEPGRYDQVAWHPDAARLAAVRCGGRDCDTADLLVWDPDLRLRLALPVPRGGARRLAWAADGATVLLASDAGGVLQLDVAPPPRLAGDVRAAAFSGDGRRLATAARDGVTVRRAADLGDPRRVVDTGDVVALRFVADDAELLLVGRDGRAQLVDVAAGEVRRAAPPRDAPVLLAALAEHGDRLRVAARARGELTAWDPRRDDPGDRWPLDGGVGPMVWRRDAAALAVAAADRPVRVYTPGVAEPLQLAAVPGHVEALEFDLNGDLLGGTTAGLVRWSLADGRVVDTHLPGGQVHSVALAYATLTLVVGLRDDAHCAGAVCGLSSLRVFGERMKQLGPPLAAGSRPFWLMAVDARGERMLAAAHTLELWDFSAAAVRADLCRRAGRELTADEWAEHIGGAPRPLCAR